MFMKTRWTIIIVTFTLFCILAVFVMTGHSVKAESLAYGEVVEHMNPILTDVMIFVTDVGAWAVIAGGTLLIILLPKTRRKWGVPVTLTVLVAAAANIALKLLFIRQRPDILRLISETGYSFPSGHAMNNIAFYTALVLLVWRYSKSSKIKIASSLGAVLIVVSIGVSRIYLGVHYATDVLGGWLMGLCVALLMDTILIKVNLLKNKTFICDINKK